MFYDLLEMLDALFRNLCFFIVFFGRIPAVDFFSFVNLSSIYMVCYKLCG